MPEILAIAWATGIPIAELTQIPTATNRAHSTPQPTNNPSSDHIRQALLNFLELDDYLNDHAIPTHNTSETATLPPTAASGVL